MLLHGEAAACFGFAPARLRPDGRGVWRRDTGGLGAGRVYAAMGHTIEATGWFRDARSTFEALGAKPWLDEVDRAERDAGA